MQLLEVRPVFVIYSLIAVKFVILNLSFSLYSIVTKYVYLTSLMMNTCKPFQGFKKRRKKLSV